MNYNGYNYYGGYTSSSSPSGALTVIGVILALVATVLLLILVVPEKRRAKLPKFFQIVHDICNFKGLLIEKVLKVLYVYSTIYVMFMGVLTWFSSGNFGTNFLIGILMIVLGPIAIRLVYEVLLLGVILVKNVIQINNKLSGKTDDPFSNKTSVFSNFTSNNQNSNQANPTQPVQQPNFDNQYNQPQQPVQQEYVAPTSSKFCTNCGQQIDGNATTCPYCGNNLM